MTKQQFFKIALNNAKPKIIKDAVEIADGNLNYITAALSSDDAFDAFDVCAEDYIIENDLDYDENIDQLFIDFCDYCAYNNVYVTGFYIEPLSSVVTSNTFSVNDIENLNEIPDHILKKYRIGLYESLKNKKKTRRYINENWEDKMEQNISKLENSLRQRLSKRGMVPIYIGNGYQVNALYMKDNDIMVAYTQNAYTDKQHSGVAQLNDFYVMSDTSMPYEDFLEYIDDSI